MGFHECLEGVSGEAISKHLLSDMFPNISVAMMILAVVPLTTCECERVYFAENEELPADNNEGRQT